jgi:hypothetical protein
MSTKIVNTQSLGFEPSVKNGRPVFKRYLNVLVRFRDQGQDQQGNFVYYHEGPSLQSTFGEDIEVVPVRLLVPENFNPLNQKIYFDDLTMFTLSAP